MKPYLPIALTALLLLTAACSKSGTNPPEPQLTVTADAGVIEAWLSVTAEDAGGMEVRLTRDGAERMRFAVVAETTVVDTGLLPSHSYTYRAELLRNDKTTASQALNLTTMDTTSHNFQWEVFEFPSPYGSGVLRDVAIIDENDIWAVGEIYSDSAQPWLPFNAVHWDGQQWALMRIKTNACGGVDYPPIETVFAFSANDVLFAHIDGSITRFDGATFINDCSLITQLNGSARKMWGRSSNDLYVVSSNGFIAHYDGANWQRIESGTKIDLEDIWGGADGREVWVCGWGWNDPGIILKKTANGWQTVWRSDVPVSPDIYRGKPNSLWFNGSREVIIAAYDIYRHSLQNSGLIRQDSLPWQNFIYRLRGSAANNIFIAGDGAMIKHYNGVSWKNFPGLWHIDNRLYGLAVADDFVIAVGTRYSGPVRDVLIVTGRR